MQGRVGGGLSSLYYIGYSKNVGNGDQPGLVSHVTTAIFHPWFDQLCHVTYRHCILDGVFAPCWGSICYSPHSLRLPSLHWCLARKTDCTQELQNDVHVFSSHITLILALITGIDLQKARNAGLKEM